MSTNTESKSVMSVTKLQKAIKDAVVPCLMDAGMSNMEVYQTDNYKWVIAVEVEGETRYAELALTAKKLDYDESNLHEELEKFDDKVRAAEQREADKAAKYAEKHADK